METPLVSVIMPSYKSNEEWIIQSIDSVLEQTYKNLELIIVCDEPTKKIEDLIQKYARNYKKVKYVKNDKKFNIGKALNQGIFLSEGKYIARIDDDDIWDDKDKIKKQVNFLEENSDYGLIGVNKVFIINKKGNIKETQKMRESDTEIRNTILQSNQFAHAGIILRKECLLYSGIYDVSCFVEDYDLWCRIGNFYKFGNIDSSIKYRVYENSLFQGNPFKSKCQMFKVFWKYKNFYPHFIKAFILRIGDFILPKKITKILIKIFKS